jgi:MscS family membrane protein
MDYSFDYIQIFIAGCFFFIVFLLKNKFLTLAENKIKASPTPVIWEDALITSVRWPATALLIVLFISYTLTVLSQIYTNQVAIYTANNFLKTTGVILILTCFILNLINRIEENYFKNPDKDSTLDFASSHALGKLVKALIVITAAVLILQTFGYSLAGLLTIGGAGSLIMGLAAKDMLANFFGGLTVNLDKPFKVGDTIKLDNYKQEGVIEKIGWRTTRLKNGEKCPVYIPNSIWSNVPVENISRMTSRRIKEVINLRYEDINKLKAIIDEIEELLLAHPGINQKQPVIIKFHEFAASALKLNLLVYTKTTKLKDHLTIKQQLLFSIADIVQKHGANFAVTDTDHMASNNTN